MGERVEQLRERLCSAHPAVKHLSGRTKVYYVGLYVSSLEHVCRVYPQRPSDLRKHKLTFVQVMHSADAAAYCERCDTLYIAEETRINE